jgi:mannonate dehydratase
VPTLEGESNELAGYHMQGRLFAVGYMRGLLDATAAQAAVGR